MKTTFKKLISILMAIVVTVSSSCFVTAQDLSEISPEDFETEYSRLEFLSAAYLYMDSDIKLGGSPHWSVSSEIYDERPVYSCYDKIIGYEFAISTDGEETGYLCLMDYGNGPEFALSSSLYTPDFIRSADYIEENSVDGKIYGGLGMYNLIKTSSDRYTVLGWDETLTTEEYQQVYDEAFYRVRENDEEQSDEQETPITVAQAEESAVSEAKLEQLYSGTDYSWAIWGDFVNVYITNPNGITQTMMGCCSPLAGTNIVRYFRSIGESSLSNSYSNNAILTGMYIAMDTNRYSTATAYTYDGTPRANIQPGFLSFCQSYAAGTPDTTVYTSASDLTESKLKSYLDDGCLLLTTVTDYMGQGAHSMVIFGYLGSNFYVADGINRGYTSMSRECLLIDHLVAIGF